MKTTCPHFHLLALSLAACILAPGILCAQQLSTGVNEGDAEASDLYRLAEFVEWPPANRAGRYRTINFCVLGQDPLGSALDHAVLGHPIDARPTVVVRGDSLRDLGPCDILFISPSKRKDLPKILNSLRDSHVVTVSVTADFAASGGAIQFVLAGGHLSFLINLDAVQRTGLKIRAPLLALARIVHDSPDKHND